MRRMAGLEPSGDLNRYNFYNSSTKADDDQDVEILRHGIQNTLLDDAEVPIHTEEDIPIQG